MDARHSDFVRHNAIFGIARHAFAVAGIGAASTFALAEPQPAPQAPVKEVADEKRSAELEKIFWVCDYTATTRGAHFTPLEVCAEVTDRLKAERFGGDFDQMVVWWRQHKSAEHSKLRLADK
jgi:hypothetical protein